MLADSGSGLSYDLHPERMWRQVEFPSLWLAQLDRRLRSFEEVVSQLEMFPGLDCFEAVSMSSILILVLSGYLPNQR